MSRQQVTPWLRTPYPATSWEGAELVEADPAYVPIILADLEPRKARSLWTDEASWEAGYDGICKQQEALLMGATERIGRYILYAMGYPRDVTLAEDGFPVVELPEATLIAIRSHLGDPGDQTLASLLFQLIQTQQTEGADPETVAEIVKALSIYLLA